jgi:hypothetical protein
MPKREQDLTTQTPGKEGSLSEEQRATLEGLGIDPAKFEKVIQVGIASGTGPCRRIAVDGETARLDEAG